MKTIKFEKLPLCKSKGGRQYYWFSAELFINGELRLGRGCAFSDKDQVNLIKSEFEKMVQE